MNKELRHKKLILNISNEFPYNIAQVLNRRDKDLYEHIMKTYSMNGSINFYI